MKVMLSTQLGDSVEMAEFSIKQAIERSGLEFEKDFGVIFTTWNSSPRAYKWIKDNGFEYVEIPFEKEKGFLHCLYSGWNSCYSEGLKRADYVVTIATDHAYYHDWLKNLLKHSKPNRIVNCKLIEDGHCPSLHTTRNFGNPIGGEFQQEEFDKFAGSICRNHKDVLATNEQAYGHRFDAMPFSLPKDVWERFGPMNLGLNKDGITGDTDFFDRCKHGGVEIVKALDSVSYHLGNYETTKKQKDGEY